MSTLPLAPTWKSVALGAVGLAALASAATTMTTRFRPAPAAVKIAAARVPDAFGSSLARSFAGAGQQVLRAGGDAGARAGCDTAIRDADIAAYRAAEDARGRDRNVQTLSLIFAAEDAYLFATRACIQAARPVCAASRRLPAACEQIGRVRESDLESVRALRLNHGG